MARLSKALFGVLAGLAIAECNVEEMTGEMVGEEDGVCLMQLGKPRKDTKIADPDAAFSKYVSTFGRDYHGSPEYEQRRALFANRLSFIQNHNANPGRMWTAGINTLTDRTDAELKELRGYRKGKKAQAGGTILLARHAETHKQPPAEVDWRHLSMALKVPDQGGCGSCWAVATKSMLEARYEVKNNASRTFAAQQLVNCVPNPRECGGSGGCEGATVELAMQYIQDAGLEEESAVPYVGRDRSCTQPMSTGAQASLLTAEPSMPSDKGALVGAANLGLHDWRTLPENQAHPLMLSLSEGPIAISIAASPWTSYQNGIFNGCSKDAVVDHAVTLFGYGRDNGTNYWLIRNSWGKGWGEDGFIRMFRHETAEEDDAHCGEDNDPAAGLACKPYPEKVTVCGMCGMLYDSVAASFA